jgi:transposase
MDTSNPAVNDSVSSRRSPTQTNRRHRSPELKREIVEETLAPGASVARVARAHGVNANQVFAWRRKYRQALLGSEKKEVPGLLAVRVAEAGIHANDAPIGRTPSGTIQIELPKGQVRLTGSVDTEALRVVLKELLA